MKIFIKIIAPILILGLAVGGFLFLGTLKPKPKSQQPPPVVPLVDLAAVSPEDHNPPVVSYGTVVSYFETSLTPQVSGKIIEVSPKFRVGEKVGAEQVLVKIDPTDFEAELAQQEANLTVAVRTFAEEEIRAEQAAGDWKASGRDVSSASDFVLRKPQLAAAKANIESAKAAIEKAQADLERTEIRAPFPAIVVARDASPGNQASPQTSLGGLVSTEKVEIRLPLTASQTARISIPTEAELTSPLKPGAEWKAKLVRMEPTVDQQNQVMYAVAEVLDPYGEGKTALPVGMFANASIEAEAIPGSYRVPEAAYVDDKFIWVMDENSELRRVDAVRVHSFDGHAFLSPVDGGQGELQVVIRPLSNFKTGMEVRTGGDNNAEDK